MKKAALALCARPAHHRRAGAHGGEARGGHPAPGDRGAALAGAARFADGARADPRRLATTSPRRSACATAWISSSPARCARWTRRPSPRTSTSRTSCSCPPRLFGHRGGIQPRGGRRERRGRAARRQAAHVHRPAARRPQGRADLRAHRGRGGRARRQEGRRHAQPRGRARAPGARGRGRRAARALWTRRAPGRCCSSFSLTPASAP